MSFIGLFTGIIEFELAANSDNYHTIDYQNKNAMESPKFTSIPGKICRWIMFISTLFTVISQAIKLSEYFKTEIKYL